MKTLRDLDNRVTLPQAYVIAAAIVAVTITLHVLLGW